MMGKEKYVSAVMSLLQRSSVVSFSSLRKIIGSEAYTKLFVHEQVRAGMLHRLTRGWYSASDDPQLLVFCFRPAYLGLQDALSYHGLWEQETVPVIVTTRKVRQGIRQIGGANVVVHRLDRKYLFGVRQEAPAHLPYTDIEKTLIDLVYFNQPLTKEVMRTMRSRINRRTLDSYLARYPTTFRKRVLRLMR